MWRNPATQAFGPWTFAEGLGPQDYWAMQALSKGIVAIKSNGPVDSGSTQSPCRRTVAKYRNHTTRQSLNAGIMQLDSRSMQASYN